MANSFFRGHLSHPTVNLLAACGVHLTSQCLRGRRFGELDELHSEIATWSAKTNARQRCVDWQFKIEDARHKLKRLHPKIKA